MLRNTPCNICGPRRRRPINPALLILLNISAIIDVTADATLSSTTVLEPGAALIVQSDDSGGGAQTGSNGGNNNDDDEDEVGGDDEVDTAGGCNGNNATDYH
jgi:hypothetical protein